MRNIRSERAGLRSIGPILACRQKFRFSITHCFRRAFNVLSPESSPSFSTAAGTHYCAALIPHYP
jgi:hypothetical protein